GKTKTERMAEARTRAKAKRPQEKKAEERPPTPPKKPAPPAPKFDPKQVEALLDKRHATRVAAAGETLNNTASLGLPNAAAAQMSLSELDALRQRLARLWTPPARAKEPQALVVQARVQLKAHRTRRAAPAPLDSG